MEPLLKRFMFLAYALHLMEMDVDIDESGLSVEQFEIIDEHLAAFLGKFNPDSLKAELIGLVHTISNMEVEE
jgi:hypothetical protein